MFKDLLSINPGSGYFGHELEVHFTIIGSGPVPKKLPFFLCKQFELEETLNLDFSEIKIFPLGYRDMRIEAASFMKSKHSKGLKSFKSSRLEAQNKKAFFCLLYTQGEEPIFGYLTTPFPTSLASFNSLGANLAFGYTPYLQNSFVSSEDSLKQRREKSDRNVESLYDIDCEEPFGFQWFTRSLYKNGAFLGTQKVSLMFDKKKTDLAYLQYAALITFSRLFAIREYEIDFIPLIKPIETKETLLEHLHSIQDVDLQNWIYTLLPELVCYENRDIRSLAAHCINTTPRDSYDEENNPMQFL